MKPDLSEFSYGYAVTEELVTQSRAAVVAAPLFPSLYQEGKAGGGFDVRIPFGIPVFLQFKLCECLERKTAKEYQQNLLHVPYFRMHIRPARHSNQHQLLLDFERSGEAVFYIAPAFHTPAELNRYYIARSVVSNSAAFSPQDLGPMPDDGPHYVVFEKGASFGYRCSQDVKEVGVLPLEQALSHVLRHRQARAQYLGESQLRALSERMLGVLEESGTVDPDEPKLPSMDDLRRLVRERSPFESAGYLARTFFDSELVVLPGQGTFRIGLTPVHSS